MAKKRKHSETKATEPTKQEDDNTAPERPKRTLLGWKDGTQINETESQVVFRNKEKVLVTCSRRISYRFCISLLGLFPSLLLLFVH